MSIEELVKKLNELAREIAMLEAEAQRMLIEEEVALTDGKRVAGCAWAFAGRIGLLQLLDDIRDLYRDGRIEEARSVSEAVEKIEMLVKMARKMGIDLPKLAEEALEPRVMVPPCMMRGAC